MGQKTVLIGAQWGDEGKGKIIDVLTAEADWVVRFQGGANAGHTVRVEDRKYVLHLIPSGILHPGKKCVIGNGMVADPEALVAELDELSGRGLSVDGRFFISDRVHLVLPSHRALDAAGEALRAEGEKIGTTRRGIGPAYTDKCRRHGVRACDIREPGFEELVRRKLLEANVELEAADAKPLDPREVLPPFLAATRRLEPYLADTGCLLHEAMRAGASVLLEGAQGTMLDVDHGTFPFVTSSSTTAGGACIGAGLSPRCIDRVIGVLKAYTTRVGEGPFPTELHSAEGERLRELGGEFGATTGRPRRCGWFDAVVARYAARVNGIDEWALTKLDVLGGFERLKVCTAYELDGRTLETPPASARQLERCRPLYEEVPGWGESISEARRLDDLPPAARDYVRGIERWTGVPVGILSVGPHRHSTMVLR